MIEPGSDLMRSHESVLNHVKLRVSGRHGSGRVDVGTVGA